jgi:uncharacterized protein (TIGR01244 family)
MPGLYKRARRAFRVRSAEFLHNTVYNSPPWLRTKVGPALCYAEMLILDYGLARVLYNNRHRISPNAWRSAQPSPHHIRYAARHGVKTVINLRGDQSFGTHWLEEMACKKNGLKLVNFKIRSRAAPTKEELKAAKALFETVEYPILIHCKSGADRAGLMSTLYRFVREGVPLETAVKELSLRYGHVRHADTGVLDYFFERYLADNAASPISFWDWVETRYDPDEVKRTFRASGWANRLINDLLHRE